MARSGGLLLAARTSQPRFIVSDLRQSRRLEMMNGSKPGGLLGGRRGPSPNPKRPRLRACCSPSPQPSPPGEGERWHGAGKFECCRCSPRFFVLRFGGIRQTSSVVLPKRGRMFLPLLGERVGVRGNEANSNPRRTKIPGIVKLRESFRRAGVSQFDYEDTLRPCSLR
jgi:hypothetical protein